MCYSLYLSTDSPADLDICSTDLVSFRKAETYEYKVESIIRLLGFPNRWFVGSQSGCSCTFRHLNAVEPGFGRPEDCDEGFEEEQVDLDATQKLFDIIVSLLSSGHRVDCIDMWEGAQPENIKTLPVSLDAVPKAAFRFFRNHKFILEKSSQLGAAPNHGSAALDNNRNHPVEPPSVN